MFAGRLGPTSASRTEVFPVRNVVALSRRLSLAVALLLCAPFVPAKTEPGELPPRPNPPIDREFHYNIGAEPQTLDPGKATEVVASIVLRNVFDGLTRPMPDGSVEPAAASSWEVSKDGLTYTFHMDPAGKWNNGEPVTAQDFEYAWLRVLDPVTTAEYASVMYPIVGAEAYNTGTGKREDVGIKAIDEKTFEVKLNNPTHYLLGFLDHSCFLPVHKETVEAGYKPVELEAMVQRMKAEGKTPPSEDSLKAASSNWALSPATFVSNGSYKITEIVPKQRIVIEPNPHHKAQADIAIRRIVLREIEDSGTAVVEFENGTIHGVHSNLPTPDIPRLRDDGVLTTNPELSTYFISFNNKKAPFDNKLVRKAFALAVNRAAIVRVMDTGDRPATGFVPVGFHTPDGKDYVDTFGPIVGDGTPDEARAALAEAGYPGGKGLPPITYIYNTDQRHKQVAEMLQNQWRTVLGVNVTVQNQEWRTLVENRKPKTGNFQIARDGWVGDYDDPMTFLEIFVSASGNNNPSYNNPAYDKLIDDARKELDPNKRYELLFQADKTICEDYGIAPLFFYAGNYLITPDIAGYQRSALQTVRFDQAYWIK